MKNFDEILDLDKELCAHNCSKHTKCKSYEYYNGLCRLSHENHPTQHKPSGFVHCSKLGLLLCIKMLLIIGGLIQLRFLLTYLCFIYYHSTHRFQIFQKCHHATLNAPMKTLAPEPPVSAVLMQLVLVIKFVKKENVVSIWI